MTTLVDFLVDGCNPQNGLENSSLMWRQSTLAKLWNKILEKSGILRFFVFNFFPLSSQVKSEPYRWFTTHLSNSLIAADSFSRFEPTASKPRCSQRYACSAQW